MASCWYWNFPSAEGNDNADIPNEEDKNSVENPSASKILNLFYDSSLIHGICTKVDNSVPEGQIDNNEPGDDEEMKTRKLRISTIVFHNIQLLF